MNLILFYPQVYFIFVAYFIDYLKQKEMTLECVEMNASNKK